MKQFDATRFLNVVRWDLTINRKFYTRVGIGIALALCSPVILVFFFGWLFGEYQLQGDPTPDSVQTIMSFLVMLVPPIVILTPGFMFHSLITKQGRINEFTLPATNLEKMLWRVIVVFVGIQVCIFLGLLLADLLHAVIGYLAFNLCDLQPITKTFYGGLFDTTVFFVGAPSKNDAYALFVFLWLMGLSYVSTFSMVNAWKYRFNIPITLAMHFFLWIVFFVFSVAISLLFPGIIVKILDSASALQSFLITLDVLAALLFVGIWMITYWLYKHAQLTSKINR